MNELLRAAREAVEAASYPNVAGTAIGYKYESDKRTKKIVVIVYVRKKLPESRLLLDQIIPKTITISGDSIETDVVESEFRALSLIDDGRPVKPGYSISHPRVTAGTLGFFARRRDKTVLVSNAHIIADTNKGKIGDPTYYPGTIDGGNISNSIGSLEAYVPISMRESKCRCINYVKKKAKKILRLSTPINYADCAVSAIYDNIEIDSNIYKIGSLKSVCSPSLGMIVSKTGRTTEHTKGAIVAIEANITVKYDQGTALFSGQIVSDIESAGGDSGSAVVAPGGKLIGLLFAGGLNLTIMNPIEEVFRSLDLDLI